jgi:hypothetical protein
MTQKEGAEDKPPALRRIADELLEAYLADELDAEARVRLESILAESPQDQEQLKALRERTESFLLKYPLEPLLERFQEERRRNVSLKSHRTLLQSLAPVLASIVRNYRAPDDMAGGSQIIDALFQHPGTEFLVLSPPATEVMRTPHVSALLDVWFAPIEHGPHGLPLGLLQHLAQHRGTQESGITQEPAPLERANWDRNLKVSFVPLPRLEGWELWALVFQEATRLSKQPRKDLLQSGKPLQKTPEENIPRTGFGRWPQQLRARPMDQGWSLLRFAGTGDSGKRSSSPGSMGRPSLKIPDADASAALGFLSPEDVAANSDLIRIWETTRGAWPQVALPADIFIRYMARLLHEERTAGHSIEELDLDGLYLACACVNYIPKAIEMLDQHYLASLPALLGYLDLSAAMLDEVCQRVCTSLLVRTPKAEPRLAQYTGRGMLLLWIRDIAVRMASMQSEEGDG